MIKEWKKANFIQLSKLHQKAISIKLETEVEALQFSVNLLRVRKQPEDNLVTKDIT